MPRVFEKVYNSAQQQASGSPARAAIFDAAAQTAIAWSQASGSQRQRALAGARGRRCGCGTRCSTGWSTPSSGPRSAAGWRTRCPAVPRSGERLGHFFRGAGITVLEGYGLTETIAAATVNRPEPQQDRDRRPAAAGRRRADRRRRRDPALGGPNIFIGYWRNDAATAEVLTPTAGCAPGTSARLDDEGYLRVTGRKKELIVTAGGKNVAPAVLEDRIRAHPLVSQCLVVGDGRPYVACLITLDPESWSSGRHGIPARPRPSPT